MDSCVQLYSLAETPQLPPLPASGLIFEGAIDQPRKTTFLCNPLSELNLIDREYIEYVLKWKTSNDRRSYEGEKKLPKNYFEYLEQSDKRSDERERK